MESPSSIELSDEEKRALLKKILADQDSHNSTEWCKTLIKVIPGSKLDPTFISRIQISSISDRFWFVKNVVCHLMMNRPNTPASEIFPALRMFDKVQNCTEYNIVCSVKAVAALLDRKILSITVSNEAEIRDALEKFHAIDFSQMECW